MSEELSATELDIAQKIVKAAHAALGAAASPTIRDIMKAFAAAKKIEWDHPNGPYFDTAHLVGTALAMKIADDTEFHPYSAAGLSIMRFAAATQAMRAWSDCESNLRDEEVHGNFVADELLKLTALWGNDGADAQKPA